MQKNKVTLKSGILNKWDLECKISNEEIRKRSSQKNCGIKLNFANGVQQIKHLVSQGETLEGISLTYNVPMSDIKRRNDIFSDEIHFIKQLIIPNPKLNKQNSLQQQNQDKIKEVMKVLYFDDNKREKAQKLLAENYWSVDRAILKYKKDIKFERKFQNILSSFNLNNEDSPFFSVLGVKTV